MTNVVADVWRNVERGAADDCWPWKAGRNAKGYGQMRVNRRQFPAHRLAYEAATGESPGDLLVLHRCDNPPCCNPAHLFLGTAGDNIRDCSAKGRNRYGSRHHAAKLTEPDVIAIRQRHAQGETRRALADEFGVTLQSVHLIVHRRIWRHV